MAEGGGNETDSCGGVVVVHRDGTVRCSVPDCADGVNAKRHVLFASCSETSLEPCRICSFAMSRVAKAT